MNRHSAKNTHPDAEYIALEHIAAQTGLTVDEVRCGGAMLFARLAERGCDLTSALVAACAASGVTPEKMVKLLPSFSAALQQRERQGLHRQEQALTNGKEAKSCSSD